VSPRRYASSCKSLPHPDMYQRSYRRLRHENRGLTLHGTTVPYYTNYISPYYILWYYFTILIYHQFFFKYTIFFKFCCAYSFLSKRCVRMFRRCHSNYCTNASGGCHCKQLWRYKTLHSHMCIKLFFLYRVFNPPGVCFASIFIPLILPFYVVCY